MKYLVKNKAQKGFTLIELVVVIVILGILAVTAAPRFINLQADARTATLEAVQASMQSAATLVHSKSLIQGNETDAVAADPTVIVNAQAEVVNLNFGYPISVDAAPKDAEADWALLLDLDAQEFIIDADAIAGHIVVYPANGAEPDTMPADLTAPDVANGESACFAFYQQVQAVGGQPVINVAVCL